ncbi:MAG: type II toxin-antitoxin system VapC family toxin [Betaproteobacteria bacterium]|nr:type II toxin-antitoxin system VapC family toxin [Betaproteobacteria bacterium]
MKYLLDTNVIAEIRKGSRANANVRSWFNDLDPDAILLSVVTIGEIRRGIESVRRRDAAGARSLERWLRRLLTDQGERILTMDLPVAEEWGRLNVPDPLPVIDGILAATARVHGLTLATRNVKDVVRSGVDLVNPFEIGARVRPRS